MKRKLLLLMLFSVGAAACGGTSYENNKPGPRPASNSSAAADPGEGDLAAANAKGNSAANSAAPVRGEKVASPLNIRFGPDGLPGGWRWIDADQNSPSAFETKGGSFKITVPSGKDLFGENRTAPHLVKAVEGDFQLETRVKFDPKESYQGAGLLVYSNGENYLRVERAFGGTGGGGSGIRLDSRTTAGYEPITTPDQVETDASTVDLKLLRQGKTFTAFWRPDENAEWKEVGEFVSNFPETVSVGIIACNTGAVISVEFEYIKLAPAV